MNIPGAKKNFILTAGHNLASGEPHTDLKVRLFNREKEISISNDDVRVNPVYSATPKDCSAEHDYGVIMLPDDEKVPSDFGFSLALGLEDRLNWPLSVTGYPTSASPGDPPETRTGRCMNPIMHKNQLEYAISTDAGLSGSPVWLPYKTHPTVVAIQYAHQTSTAQTTILTNNPSTHTHHLNKRTHGSRGARLTLPLLLALLAWTGVSTSPKLLRASPRTNPSHPPLRLTFSPADSAFRVLVDDVDDPPHTMLFTVLPVYAAPSAAKAPPPPAFGFLQEDGDGSQRWVSWKGSPGGAVGLVGDLRGARLARVEGGGWDCGGEFAVVVRPPYGGVAGQGRFGAVGGGQGDQVVVFEYKRVAGWQLEGAGEVMDAIGYRGGYCGNRRLEVRALSVVLST